VLGNMTRSQMNQSLPTNIFGNLPIFGSTQTSSTQIGTRVADSNFRGRSTAGRLLPKLFGATNFGSGTKTVVTTSFSTATDDNPFDESPLFGTLRNLALMSFDLFSEIIRKILGLENIVKTTDCQISVAKKAQIMPVWINW